MSNSELSRREFLGVASAPFAADLTTKTDRSEPIGEQTSPDRWFADVPVGRSIVRAGHAMVATSQPLASQTGIDILKRGGNAADAAIAMAAVLNVTEPPMTGVGGDVFAMVYSAKTQKLDGLNASGRA